MSCTACDKRKPINEPLQMSLVPLPCQEYQLSATSSESIDWLLDLKHQIPIWSRLNEINTSGFKRKLPMSVIKNYDIEINGRLWSLWGHKRKHRKTRTHSKSHMAITVMALCAARVIRLNIWSTDLMDCIRDNGREFYKKSLNKISSSCKKFQLENLASECCLEGIRFRTCLKTAQKGQLYSSTPEFPLNLACSLKYFFTRYQFGILECCNRLLGVGCINGPKDGGYFMYDAQSMNYPLFAKNVSTPYLLRTNHLQVLLYCLIVSLNVPNINAPFSLHHVQIQVIKPKQFKAELKSLSNCISKCPRIIPSKFWKTPSIFSLKCSADKTSSSIKVNKFKRIICTSPLKNKTSTKTIYRRKMHNITKEKVEKSVIKPLVDPDRKTNEDMQVRRDFVRMICSETAVPLMPADLPKTLEKEFACNLLDALVMGPKTCLTFKEL